jgi:hypothetical protein
VSGGNNPTGYRDLNRSPGITVAYQLTDGGTQWTARDYGNDPSDSFSPRQLVLGQDGSAYTAGQLTNNVQSDSSDNVYDAMLVGYRADAGPAPSVPEGQPWLIGLAALLMLGFAARARHSYG